MKVKRQSMFVKIVVTAHIKVSVLRVIIAKYLQKKELKSLKSLKNLVIKEKKILKELQPMKAVSLE